MGYDTRYTIDWQTDDEDIDAKIRDSLSYDNEPCCDDDWCGHEPPISLEIPEEMRELFDEDGKSYQPWKWYDHDDDMKTFSLLFKDIMFSLSGEGDDAGDVWKHYYRNGEIISSFWVDEADSIPENFGETSKIKFLEWVWDHMDESKKRELQNNFEDGCNQLRVPESIRVKQS